MKSKLCNLLKEFKTKKMEKAVVCVILHTACLFNIILVKEHKDFAYINKTYGFVMVAEQPRSRRDPQKLQQHGAGPSTAAVRKDHER